MTSTLLSSHTLSTGIAVNRDRRSCLGKASTPLCLSPLSPQLQLKDIGVYSLASKFLHIRYYLIPVYIALCNHNTSTLCQKTAAPAPKPSLFISTLKGTLTQLRFPNYSYTQTLPVDTHTFQTLLMLQNASTGSKPKSQETSLGSENFLRV